MPTKKNLVQIYIQIEHVDLSTRTRRSRYIEKSLLKYKPHEGGRLSNSIGITDRGLQYFANHVNRGAATFAVCCCELECSRIKLEQVFVSSLPNGYDAVLRSCSHEKAFLGSSQPLPDIGGIRTGLDPEAPEIVRITVEDSDCGIPAHIIENVFQPFFTTRSGAGGTGLGLALCRSTVESLKETIKVSSAGRGARFVSSLPIRKTAAAVLISA